MVRGIYTIYTIANFLVQDNPHKGGMGEVYIGTMESDRNLYALKTIRDDKIKDERQRDEFIKRFRWESQVWIILGKHKNIVQAYWYDLTSEGKPVLILEYVEGHSEYGNTLDKWLKKTSLDLPTILSFAIQACTGLLYARKVVEGELNIPFVHRDLKPSNIMITKESIAKVTDFGLVKAFVGIEGNLELKIEDDLGERFSVLKTGGICGTPPYMAPEQWLGEEPDEKTDVYAIGCVLYEMITGLPPFLGPTKELFRTQHLQEKPAIPRRLGEKIPEELINIIMTCLEKRRKSRIEGFLVLREQLQEIYKFVKGKRLSLKDEPEEINASDWHWRGAGFMHLGFGKKALYCYNRAIQMDPCAAYYTNRAVIYQRLEQYEQIIEDCNEALRLNPKHASAFNERAVAYNHFRQYEQAIEDCNEAIRLNPNFAEAYHNRALALEMSGYHEKAIEDYNKAIKLKPGFALPYYNKAELLQNHFNKYEDALGVWEIYLRLAQDDLYEKRNINNARKLMEEAKEEVSRRLQNG